MRPGTDCGVASAVAVPQPARRRHEVYQGERDCQEHGRDQTEVGLTMAYVKWEPGIERKLQREISRKFRNLKVDVPAETPQDSDDASDLDDRLPDAFNR